MSRIAVPIALALVSAAGAQEPQRPLTIRVSTQLVQVSVVVKDSHGNPVADLKQSDFEMYDKGKPQEIRVFRVEDYRSARTEQAPAAASPAATPQRVFSNRAAPDAASPNPPSIIVIDAGNTWDPARMTWEDLVFARDQLIRFLRQVRPEDRLGIYLMGSDRFWVLHEYNQSCADLVQRLATWKEKATPEPAVAKLDAWTEFAVHFAHVDAATARAIHRSQFFESDAAKSSALPATVPDEPGGTNREVTPGMGGASEDALSTAARGVYLSPGTAPIQVLAAVANHLAAVPGRKNVFVISGKMFLPPEFKDQIKVLRPLIESGVAVYTIDPGGLAPYALDASFAIPSSVTQLSGNAPGATPDAAASDYVNRSMKRQQQLTVALQTSLAEIAKDTGGRVFVNTNDVFGALRNSFEDSGVTYTLGFYPKDSRNDGSFHPVEVKVPSRQHVSIRCRNGYFEQAPPARDPHLRELELQRAIWSPVDASGIGLTALVSQAATPSEYDLKMNIGLASISMQRDGDRWNGAIEVDFVERDNSGNDYEALSQTMGLRLKQESYDKALRDGLPYAHSFRLDPKARSVRIVVRDVNSENSGSLTIPVPFGAS